MSDWDDDEAFNFAMSMEAEEAERQHEEHQRAIADHLHDDTWEDDRPHWVTV